MKLGLTDDHALFRERLALLLAAHLVKLLLRNPSFSLWVDAAKREW